MANRKGRRLFRSIRKRSSGRRTARVPILDSGGQTRSIGTFPTKRAAEDALAIERGAIVTGTWIDPDPGSVNVDDYAATFRRRAAARHQRTATSPKAVNAAIRVWAERVGIAMAASGRIPATVRAQWEASGGPDALLVDIPPTAGATEAAQAYRLLHAVLERARQDGLIRGEPGIHPGCVRRGDARTHSREDG